jgi:hypothetical protein
LIHTLTGMGLCCENCRQIGRAKIKNASSKK